MRFRIGVLVAVFFAAFAVQARISAHHSVQAQFDVNKQFSISGTVARVEFVNPHSYLTLNVKGSDGKMVKWAFEMTGLGGLRRAGLSRADRGGLKAGDEVTVTALAARDGSNSGLAQVIKMADGRVFKLTADAPDVQ